MSTQDEQVQALAKVIWATSRADESTISAAGANIVARALLDSDALRALIAEERAAALREAADEVEDECLQSRCACFCGSAGWLRDHADHDGGA